MSGTFTCTVDFDTDQISVFKMDIQGGGKGAHIEFGSGTIQSDGTFSVTNGLWSLGVLGSETAPDYKTANGSLYGGNRAGVDAAKGIGGVWGMYKTNGEGATGMFHGSRP